MNSPQWQRFVTPENLYLIILRYATGTISRSYMPGQVIDIEIYLIANHLVRTFS